MIRGDLDLAHAIAFDTRPLAVLRHDYLLRVRCWCGMKRPSSYQQKFLTATWADVVEGQQGTIS
jgi:hypothetical protein